MDAILKSAGIDASGLKLDGTAWPHTHTRCMH